MSDDQPAISRDTTERIEDLLHRDVYTPEEAAEVLGIGARQIYAAAFRGELKANIVGRDVVSIDRADLVDWVRNRP